MAGLSAGLSLFTREWTTFELFKNYIDYVMDNELVADRDACIAHVGKIVSALMDRGEASVAAWERVKNYINQRPIKLAEQQEVKDLDLLADQLMCAVMNYCGVSLVNGATGNITDTEKNIINKFLAARDAYELAKREVAELSRKPTTDLVTSLVTTHENLFERSFVEKLRNKVRVNLVEYQQP